MTSFRLDNFDRPIHRNVAQGLHASVGSANRQAIDPFALTQAEMHRQSHLGQVAAGRHDRSALGTTAGFQHQFGADGRGVGGGLFNLGRSTHWTQQVFLVL